ncbi:uncharacterized protein [Haliotis cracherodii]|uniref:uncharacterized protein n=1 Tax=Haliotis cracherodii TaxID=6455 RepID=UPI0039ED754B
MATASQDSIPRHLMTPPGLVLKDSGVEDGTIGVFCLNRVLEGQVYGPYAGEVILEGCDNKVDYRYAWEVYDSNTNELMHIINATKPETGNWMRYVNCARYFEEQNIVSVQIGSEIFYKAIRDIPAGEELLTWFSLSYQMQKKKKKKRKSVDAQEEKETVTAPNKRKKKSSSVSESTPGDDMGTPLLYEIMTADTKLKKAKESSAMVDEMKKPPKLSKSKSTGSIDVNMLKGSLKKPTTPTKKAQTASSTPIKDLIIVPSAAASPGISSKKITPKKALKVKDLIAMQDAKNGVSKSDISPSPKKLPIPKLKNMSSTSPKVKGQSKVKADGPPDLAMAGMVLHSEYESGKIFQFEVRPEHHAENKLGKKMFSCDICHAPYNHAFSLKRHFLRSHINAKYLPLSDITNCLINVVLQESAVRSCTGNARWFSKEANKKQKSSDVVKDQDTAAEDTEESKETTTMPGVYRCYLCAELYDDLDGLKKHTQNHPSQEKVAKKLPCEKCSMTFSGKNSLARHQETHLESKQVNCMVCGKGFTKESNMKKHLQFHLNKNFACGICSEKFTTVAELRKHVRMEHSGSESKMAVQLKQMESGRDKPVRMEPSELAKKPVKVNIIKKKKMKKKMVAAALASPAPGSSQVGGADHSSANMDPNKPIPCPICNKRFSSEASMKKHAQFHGNRRFSCRYCKEKFPHPFGLRKHLWSIHTAQMKQNLNRTPGVIRKVPNFHQKKNETYDEKFPEKAADKTDVEKMVPDIKEEGKPVKQLAAVAESQKASAEKPYSCRVCGKAFPSEANMKMHLQYHFGRTFSCRFCFKKFPHPASLRKHLNAEHPEGMVNGVLIKNKPDIIIGPDGKRLKRKRKKKVKSELELMLRTENAEVKTEDVVEVKQEQDVDNESTQSQEFESARLEKISQEAEEEDPWEEEIQITKELKKKARLHFACILCKKKFNSYVNMCRHKRLAHRVKKYGMPTVTRQRIAARLQDCVVVNDYIPITPAEFYASIADNIATNLDNYIDGKQEALTNYEKHVRIPDYQSVYTVASEEQPQLDWSKYNFPKSYTPWQGIVGYDIEEDLLSIYDKIGFRDERAARRLRRSRSSSDASFEVENKETGDENSNLSIPERKSVDDEAQSKAVQLEENMSVVEDGGFNSIGSSPQLKSESKTCDNGDKKSVVKTEKADLVSGSDSMTDKDCHFVPGINEKKCGSSVLEVKPNIEKCSKLIPEVGSVAEKDVYMDTKSGKDRSLVFESEPKPENDGGSDHESVSKIEKDAVTAQQETESNATQDDSGPESQNNLQQHTPKVDTQTQFVSRTDTSVLIDIVSDGEQPEKERCIVCEDDEKENIKIDHNDVCSNGEVMPYTIPDEIDYEIEECMNEMIEQCAKSQQNDTDSVQNASVDVPQDEAPLIESPQMNIESVTAGSTCACASTVSIDAAELVQKGDTISTTEPCERPGKEDITGSLATTSDTSSGLEDGSEKNLVKECMPDQQKGVELFCITESRNRSSERSNPGMDSSVDDCCEEVSDGADKCGGGSSGEKSKRVHSIQVDESRGDSLYHVHRSDDSPVDDEDLVKDPSVGVGKTGKDLCIDVEKSGNNSSIGVEELVKDFSIGVDETGKVSTISVAYGKESSVGDSEKEINNSSLLPDKTRSDSSVEESQPSGMSSVDKARSDSTSSVDSFPCESKVFVTNNISIPITPATTETVPITSVPLTDATHVIQSDSTVSEPLTQDIFHSKLTMDAHNYSQPSHCDSLVLEEKSCPVLEHVSSNDKPCSMTNDRSDSVGQGTASECDPDGREWNCYKEKPQKVEVDVLDERKECVCATDETKTSCRKTKTCVLERQTDSSVPLVASSCNESPQPKAGDCVRETEEQSNIDSYAEFSAKIGLVEVKQSDWTMSESPSVASIDGEADVKMWIKHVVLRDVIQKVFTHPAAVASNNKTVIEQELVQSSSVKNVNLKMEASFDGHVGMVKTEPEESTGVDRDIEDAVESILCEVASNNITSDTSPLLEGNNNKITSCMESIKIEIPPVLVPYYEDYDDGHEEDSSQIASHILSDIINSVCPVSEDEVKFSSSEPKDTPGLNDFVMTAYNDHLKSPTSILRHLQLIRWDKESLDSLTVNISDDDHKEEEIPPQGKVIRCKPNLQLSPVPSASFNTISFGSHGPVNYICGVCKKHFLMTDALLRHHFKKHPSIDFSYIEIENGNDIDLLFYTWPCNFGLLASSQPFSEDCRNLDLFTCTRCGSTFKHIHRLHVHIINCDPKNYETLASKRRKYRRKIRKQLLEAMKSKTTEAEGTPAPVVVAAPRRPGRPRGILGRKKRLDGIIDSPKNRKRRNYELLYNPHNHIRRREMTDVLEKHQCRGCENTFKTLSLLERHAKKCSGRDKLQSLRPVQSSLLEDMAQKPRHTCRYCSKHFTYLKSLANHYRAFCSIRKSRQQKGLLGADDFQDEEDLLKLIKKLEMAKLESKETEVDENDGRRKRGGWPRGMKRKNRRKRHCWTYVKKRKPDDKDEVEGELVDPMLWNPEVDWMDELLPAGHGEEDDSEEEEEEETKEAVPEEGKTEEENVKDVKKGNAASGKEVDVDSKKDIPSSAKPESAKPESPRKVKKKASSTVKEEATDVPTEEPKIQLEVSSPRKKNIKIIISEPVHDEPEATHVPPPAKETEGVGSIHESEDNGKDEEPEGSGCVQDSVEPINVPKSSSGPEDGGAIILSPVKSEGEIPATSEGSGTPGSSPEKKKRKYVRKVPLEEVLLKKKKNRMMKLGLIGDGGTVSKQTESSLIGSALGSPTKKKKAQVGKSEPVKIAPVMGDLKLAQVSDIVMKPALAIKTASPMNMTKNKDVLDGGTVTLITVFPQSKPSIINTPIIQIVNEKPINISPKKTKQDSPPQKTVKQSPNRCAKDGSASATESPSPLKTAKVKTPRKIQKSPCKTKTMSLKTEVSLSDHVEIDSLEKSTKKTPKKNKRATAVPNSSVEIGSLPTVVKTPTKTTSKKSSETCTTHTGANTESNTTSKGKTTPKKTPVKVKVTPKKVSPESGGSKKGAQKAGNVKKTPTKCQKTDKTVSVKKNVQVSETDKASPSGKGQPKKRRTGLNSSLLCEEDPEFLFDSDDSEEVLARKRPKPRLKCVIENPNLVNKVSEFGSESDISR